MMSSTADPAQAQFGSRAPFGPPGQVATQGQVEPSASWGAGAPVLVPAVERASRLLDRLTVARRGGASLAQLSTELALPKSSVHNLLRTMVRLGLVRREASGGFSLGPKVLQWASAYSGQNGLVEGFYDAASSLPALNAETIMLSVLAGSEVLYLASRPGTHPLAVNFRVGGRFPATMSDAAIKTAIGPGPYPKLTAHSRTDWPSLALELARARRDGVGTDDEETGIGMHCYGASIFEAGSPIAVAAVAVSLIKASVEPARHDAIVAALRALAARLSRLLGGNLPSTEVLGRRSA
jgi:IclR family transcriptional regulator, blcABC operon repressor